MANLKILSTPCSAHGIVNCPTCGSGSVSPSSAAGGGVLTDRVIVQSPGDDIHPGGDYRSGELELAAQATPTKAPAVKNPARILKASKGG